MTAFIDDLVVVAVMAAASLVPSLTLQALARLCLPEFAHDR